VRLPVTGDRAFEVRSGSAYFDDDRFGFLQPGNIGLRKDRTIDSLAVCERKLPDAKVLELKAEQALA
jgi:hypothetical protein